MFTNAAIHSRAAVTTLGDGSSGIHLLSVGGNGGNGGSSDCCNGGGAGNGADGGTVQLGNSALVTQVETSGNQAHGLFVVSQGGNGGNGGAAGIAGGGKNGGGGGGGGSLSVLGSHTITTTGTQAHGIGAYSLGGPGGQGSDGSFFNPSAGGGGSTGTSGPVDVNVGGTIRDVRPGVLRHPRPERRRPRRQRRQCREPGQLRRVGRQRRRGRCGDGQRAAPSITTVSDQSVALAAQSIGGGGGNGGSGFGVFYGQGGSGSIGGGGGVR